MDNRNDGKRENFDGRQTFQETRRQVSVVMKINRNKSDRQQLQPKKGIKILLRPKTTTCNNELTNDKGSEYC
jgi:hypothetical protein